MMARSAWSCSSLTGTPTHSPGTEEAFLASQHPQALFQRSLSAPPTGGPRDASSAGKVQPQLSTASRIQPAHRAGGSQGLYTSPAAAIGAAACLGLPPCLSTALGGVEPGSHRLLVSHGRRRAPVTRPENLAPGRHCEVTATGTLPSAPYRASPDTRPVRAASSAVHLKEALGVRIPQAQPRNCVPRACRATLPRPTRPTRQQLPPPSPGPQRGSLAAAAYDHAGTGLSAGWGGGVAHQVQGAFTVPVIRLPGDQERLRGSSSAPAKEVQAAAAAAPRHFPRVTPNSLLSGLERGCAGSSPRRTVPGRTAGPEGAAEPTRGGKHSAREPPQGEQQPLALPSLREERRGEPGQGARGRFAPPQAPPQSS
ncbi:unnamed protein product [Rangifer tarandus platyrhynchus]|uniref:Uncharacterized protein n=2 Tax=Rangifer tarandus platyrhynchus TaxID=3082113 RepID=A0ABN8Y7Z4_RANTA|nr:unnamed protein product [Rangifer tarandus platyrhynchus]CAI9695881.1 unnamed protein product [Rangifer tarandus platyrhynchus]